MAVVRQRPPTAKGFVFLAVEAEDGLREVIVKPDVYQRYYKLLRNCLLLIVEGTSSKGFSTCWLRVRCACSGPRQDRCERRSATVRGPLRRRREARRS